MRPSLPALEKNILKYRALQMILLLHQTESFKSFVIGSIRSTGELYGHHGLPAGAKHPLKNALAILVERQVITQDESADLQSIIELRNTIAHSIHQLVKDISAPTRLRRKDAVYDYLALERFERLRDKVMSGMTSGFILQLSFRGIEFEQAEATYKEEIARLRKKIDRQYVARRDAA